jgi:hypothetical protein
MFSSTVNSRALVWARPVLACFLVGTVLRSLEISLTDPAPVAGAGQAPSARHGMLAGFSGGLRAVVAGGCWLRTNLAWESRDETATVTWLELTVAADERPAYFWINGARMLAYDMPGWKTGGDLARDEWFARRALDFLEKGRRRRGDDAALLIETANVHLRRRGDLLMAAYYYRRAAEQPGAPYYAARIHAELLQALGRPRDALAWLRQVLPHLPPDDADARRATVEARIRRLEEMTRQ